MASTPGRRLGALLVATGLLAAACGGEDLPEGEVLDTEEILGDELSLDEAVASPEPEEGTPEPTVTSTPTPVPKPDAVVVEGEATGRIDPLARIEQAVTGQPVYFDLDEGVTQRGVTDTAITVAGVVSATLEGEALLPGLCDGALARFDRANREGELSRRIRFADCTDDESDPGQNQLALERLINVDEVFAVVPSTSVALFDDRVLVTERVMHVGWGPLPVYCGYQSGFALGATGAIHCPVVDASGFAVSTVGLIEAYARAAVTDTEGLRVAYLGEDSAHGMARIAGVELEAAELGALLVHKEAVIPAPTDAARERWSDVASQMIDIGPDVIIVDGGRSAGLYDALTAGGFAGDIVGTTYGDPQELLADPDVRGAVSGSYQVTQGFDLSGAGESWTFIVEDALEIGLNEAAIGKGFLSGYAAADLFVEAVAVTPEPLSAEALYNTINAGWEYRGIPGVVCGGWWPVSHILEYPCASVAQVRPFGEPLRSRLGPTEFEVRMQSFLAGATEGDDG